MRWIAALVALVAVLLACVYYAAGRGAPPRVSIEKPDAVVGQTGTLDVTAEAPNARFSLLTITVEQNGRTMPLFRLEGDARQGAITGANSGTLSPLGPDSIRITRPFGKQSVPELQAGPARIVVTAERKSFLNLKTFSSTANKDVVVRLEPPRIAVTSTKHYVNQGGSELVVYRATPPDVASGVRVGDLEYRGFSVGGDPATKAAFFALLHDQPLKTPIVAFARDEAGNEAHATFVDNVFPKPFKKSRIELDDMFVNRVVPEILQHSPELKMPPPPEGSDMLPGFLKINGELRKINGDAIAALTAKTSPTRLWKGPFVQLGNWG